MSWIDKLLPPQIQPSDPTQRKSVPEGLWVKCVACESVLYRTDVEANLFVCPKCNHHMRIRARVRLEHLLDQGGRYEIGQEVLANADNKSTVFAEVTELGTVVTNNTYMQKHIDAILAHPLVNAKAIAAKNFSVVVDAINSTGATFVPALVSILGRREVKAIIAVAGVALVAFAFSN